MRVLFCLVLNLSFLLALDVFDIKNWNDAGSYNRICQDSIREFFIKNQDVQVANIYANACLKMDKINELIIPMVMLYESPYERENAALYATILFQKKMLYLALADGVDISYIRTPKVDYILSMVFDKFVLNEYRVVDGAFRIDLEQDVFCDLLINEENGILQMIIAIYEDGKIKAIKKYW